jgi:outer membrane receptor for ferrienterochelin and colicins
MNRIILVLALLLYAADASAQNQIPPIPSDTTSHKDSSIDDQELEEVVIISTTRTTRTIANLPTRVEVIGGEEVDEKNNMRPANVSMLLHESTGMQVQQTSATSGNASIRIQGLDGRYTQLLKDGYPNFGNFSGGLSILEIPPLDLKQVEIIKGPASTLYGAGAIAGVVNFVSRTPSGEPSFNAIINQSHVGQTNVGGFAAQRGKKFGYTMLALYNRQLAYDVDKDGFTELPKSADFTLHPRLFFYPNARTTMSIGNSFTRGDRTGGDVDVIENGSSSDHTFFEENKTLRNVATLDVQHTLKSEDRLSLKASYSYFERTIEVPGYLFEGTSNNMFAELTYLREKGAHTILAGTNFISDDFIEQRHSTPLQRDFRTTTGGLFAQHTWDASSWFKLESGLRLDAVDYGNGLYKKTELLLLPRISGLFILNSKLSSRIGIGKGYKTPTLFTEQTEGFQYQNVLPLNNVKSERSVGGTADVNYRSSISNDLSFSLNHMFFVTSITNPTVLMSNGPGTSYFFVNLNKQVISSGFETNLKFVYQRVFKLFVGYTFTDATAEYLPLNKALPLLPRNKLNLALVYEKEGFLKAGLEAYFTDRQYLSDGSRTPSFWELGAMVEKSFGKVSLFVNAENFTDVRQSRYKGVVNGPHTAPYFDEIWTHTEGFVVNGGIKLKL